MFQPRTLKLTPSLQCHNVRTYTASRYRHALLLSLSFLNPYRALGGEVPLVRWVVEVPGSCIGPVLHPSVHRVPVAMGSHAHNRRRGFDQQFHSKHYHAWLCTQERSRLWCETGQNFPESTFNLSPLNRSSWLSTLAPYTRVFIGLVGYSLWRLYSPLPP